MPIRQIKIAKNNYRIFGFVFTLIGLVMLFAALGSFLSIKKTVSRYIEAEGTVISNIECGNKNRVASSKPVVLFRAKNGKVVEFSPTICESPPTFRENELVKVLYQENAPEQALLAENSFLYFPVIMWGIFCFVFLVLGIMIILLKGDSVATGEKAGRVFFIISFLVGSFTVLLGTKNWTNSSVLVFGGILVIVLGIMVWVWEKIKEKMS